MSALRRSYTVEETKAAAAEGFAAFQAGRGLSANPHTDDRRLRDAWTHGWHKARIQRGVRWGS